MTNKNKYENIKELINENNNILLFCINFNSLISKEKAFEKCFNKAWRDCFQGFRYYSYLSKELSGRKKKIAEVLNYTRFRDVKSLKPRDLIAEISKIIKFERFSKTSYGAAQKIVNMLFKYLFLYQDFTGISFKKKELDCPLDSIILSWVDGYENEKWTQLSKNTYIEIQKRISKIIDYEQDSELFKLSKKCGNLAFDFIHWPHRHKKIDNK